MGGLVNKLLAPVFFSAALLLPDFSFAKDVDKPENSFGFGFGIHQPSDQVMYDVYGPTFPHMRLMFSGGIGENLIMRADLNYLKNAVGKPKEITGGDAEVLSSSAKLDMRGLGASVQYCFGSHPDRSGFRIGGGYQWMRINEKVGGRVRLGNDEFDVNAENTVTTTGPYFIVGVDLMDSGGYAEIEVSSLNYTNTFGNSLDFGGISFMIGFKF